MLEDETVELAFKCGKDFYMSTTKRWIKVDVQSRDGSKVSYESVPISSVRCFDVTTAAENPFDSDAEIGLLTEVGAWGFDVKKGQGDIMAVYTIMNQKCVLARARGCEGGSVCDLSAVGWEADGALDGRGWAG